MDIYLNISLDKIDPGLLFTLSAQLTFDGIRIPVNHLANEDVIELLNCCKELELKVILLIPDEDNDLITDVKRITEIVYNTEINLDDIAFEIVDEADSIFSNWKDKPEKLGTVFNKCVNIIRNKLLTVNILTPSISNLGNSNIAYLKRMFSTIDKNNSFIIAVHRYPAFLNDFDSAHEEFGHRSHEIEALKTVIGRRYYWITSTGCSQNYRQIKLTKDKIINISERDQTEYFSKELKYWKERFVPVVAWQHLDDGPDETQNKDGYGIRKNNYVPKHIWYSIPQVITTAHL